MSRKSTDSANLGALVFTRLATWLKPKPVFLGEAGGEVDVLVESFRAWCAAHEGTVCDLALSSRWVVSCVPPAGAGALTPRELRQYAERQIAHYLEDAGGPGNANWAIAVSDRPDVALACAATVDLINRLKTAATAHHVSIRRIFPWWLAAVSQSPGSTNSLVLAEPGIVTVLHFLQGRLHHVGTDFDADRIEQGAVHLWPGSEPMPVVCDAVPVANLISTGLSRRGSIDLDLMGTPARAWWGSWALMLVAVIFALMEARHEDGLWSAQAREQAMLERVQASRSRARSSAEPAQLPAATGVAPDVRTLEAAADMLALQQHPWADVFAGVEAAGDHVAMLSLQHDATQSVIDVEVVVPNDDAAWAFAERMAADSGRFKSATLVTRQPLESPVGGLTGRARVQAVLATVPAGTRGNAP